MKAVPVTCYLINVHPEYPLDQATKRRQIAQCNSWTIHLLPNLQHPGARSTCWAGVVQVMPVQELLQLLDMLRAALAVFGHV